MDDNTTPEHINPRDVLLERFIERQLMKKQEEDQLESQNEFDRLSNLKKDMVRRKIRKLIRRNQRGITSGQIPS